MEFFKAFVFLISIFFTILFFVSLVHNKGKSAGDWIAFILQVAISVYIAIR